MKDPNAASNFEIALVLLVAIGIPLFLAWPWFGPVHDYELDRRIAYCVSLDPSMRADCLYPPDGSDPAD